MSKKTGSSRFGLRSARLFAVQAIYQTMYSDHSLEQIIDQFRSFHFNIIDQNTSSKIKKFDLFSKIVTYAYENNVTLDKTISMFIKSTWKIDRINSITKAILYCGVSELESNEKKTIGFLINEYVDIAKKFLESPDVSFINNILDKIANQKI